jgi:hypothetical protein
MLQEYGCCVQLHCRSNIFYFFSKEDKGWGPSVTVAEFFELTVTTIMCHGVRVTRYS